MEVIIAFITINASNTAFIAFVAIIVMITSIASDSFDSSIASDSFDSFDKAYISIMHAYQSIYAYLVCFYLKSSLASIHHLVIFACFVSHDN